MHSDQSIHLADDIIIKKSTIYEDKNIVVINKPFGIPVQSGSGIKESIDFAIKSIYKDAHVVHRLDKHTTGVLIFAKNLKSTTEIWNLFKNRKIDKKYIAIVVGKINQKSGQIKNFLKKGFVGGEEIMQCDLTQGDLAITNFTVVDVCKDASLVSLEPKTGRKHQIRVHMNHLGHPILCDGKYGRKTAFLKSMPNKNMNLHAESLRFCLFGKSIEITAKKPAHFEDNCSFLFNVDEKN